MLAFEIILGTTAYLLIGSFFRAFYICKHTREDGYLSAIDEEFALFLQFAWPFFPVTYLVLLPFKACFLFSNYLTHKCRQFKYGPNCKKYY
jgi:hypothetical protein